MSSREKLIDVLVMSPMSDYIGTSLLPVEKTASMLLESEWLAEVKAQAWEEGQLALLEYMGVPLYPSKGDEPRNPKQPRNPYRQGGEQ